MVSDMRSAAEWLGDELPFIEYGELDPRVNWIAGHVAWLLEVRGRERQCRYMQRGRCGVNDRGGLRAGRGGYGTFRGYSTQFFNTKEVSHGRKDILPRVQH